MRTSCNSLLSLPAKCNAADNIHGMSLTLCVRLPINRVCGIMSMEKKMASIFLATVLTIVLSLEIGVDL
jgi:hypothetical protein